MSRGFFISLDGLDGAGKSTQCRLLADWLRGRGDSVVTCHDPGGTDLGQQLRHVLLNYRGSMSVTCEALLFMASRAQLVAEVIRPALDAGQIVISDRFLLANVVYQGHAGGLDPAQLWNVGLFGTGTHALLRAPALAQEPNPPAAASKGDAFGDPLPA